MFPKGIPVEVAASTHAICFGLPNSDPYYLCHFLILVGFHDTSAPLSGSSQQCHTGHFDQAQGLPLGSSPQIACIAPTVICFLSGPFDLTFLFTLSS